jgi:hypothetical protein
MGRVGDVGAVLSCVVLARRFSVEQHYVLIVIKLYTVLVACRDSVSVSEKNGCGCGCGWYTST